MYRRKKAAEATALFLSLVLAAAGCGTTEAAITEEQAGRESTADSGGAVESQTEGTVTAESAQPASAVSGEDMFTDRDREISYEESEAAVITLEGSSAQCSSDAVEIDGTTITITDEGTYLLSGTLEDGMVIVDAEKTDKLQLVLNGVSINSSTSAALYIRQADKVFVTTAEGTENTLANGGEFVEIDENNIDSAVFSKEDLTLNGAGTLTVESPAGHGVVSKDDLVVAGGTYVISSASQGLNGKDSVRIADGDFTITSGKDGIHSENTEDEGLGFVYIAGGSFQITAEGDGISASGYLQAEDGEFDIVAGGGSENGEKASSDAYGQFGGGGRQKGDGGMKELPGAEGGTEEAPEMPGEMPEMSGEMLEAPGDGTTVSDGGETVSETEADRDNQENAEAAAEEESASMKGLKAGGDLVLNGGTYRIDAADDGVHSNRSILVSGGDFEIATGDDGFHGDQVLTVEAGTIAVSECYEGLEALAVEISGGEISITATDDGINAAGGADASGMGGRDGQFGGGGFSSSGGSLEISGGTLTIQASGDALDSNGTLAISGGTLVTSGPDVGDTSILDYETEGRITGGTFMGTGASSMAQNFSESSEQGAILAAVGSQSAGTEVTLKDSEGNVLLSQEAALDFSCVIVSSENIVEGETYTLTAGTFEEEIEMDSLVYTSAGAGQMNPGQDGGRGGMGGAGGSRPADMEGTPPGGMAGTAPEGMGGMQSENADETLT